MGISNEAIKLAVKGVKGSGVQKEILEALGKVDMKMGDIKMKPFNVDEIKSQYGTEPRTMTNVPTGNQEKWTGAEAMIELIIEKLVDKLADAIVSKLIVTIPVGTVVTGVTGGAAGTFNPAPIECKII